MSDEHEKHEKLVALSSNAFSRGANDILTFKPLSKVVFHAIQGVNRRIRAMMEDDDT